MATLKELLTAMVDKINGKIVKPDAEPAPFQQLVTDADGMARWEDRLAYESITEYLMEPTNVVMDHETTLPNGDSAVAGNGPEIGSVDLVDLYVKWDGIEYYFETSTHLGGSGSGAVFGVGVETEDGFLIVAGNAPFPIEIISPYGDIGDVHNVAIYKRENKTVKPIDPKYLPSEVPAIQSAQVGQTVVVKSVDENGKPTEWETVEIPEGFSGSWNDLSDKPFEAVDMIDVKVPLKSTSSYINVGGGDTYYRYISEVNPLGPMDLQAGDEIRIRYEIYTADNVLIIGTYDDAEAKTPFNVTVSEYEGMLVAGATENEMKSLMSDTPSGMAYVYMDDGWYFMYAGNSAVVGIEDTSYAIISIYDASIKTVDERCIPDSIARTADIPTDDHINEFISTALAAIPNAEEASF